MKNKFLKLICLLLCLAMALSAFAGCKGKTSAKKIKKDPKKNSSVSSEESTVDTSSDGWGDEYVEPIEDDPIDEEPIDEEEPDTIAEATVKNTAPLTQNVMGAGMGLYSPYAFMDNKIVPRDKVANTEFDRLQNMGIHTVRSMFKFEWLDEGRNDGVWNWESSKMQAYYKWLQAMKDRNINVFVNPWSFAHIADIESYRYWDTKCFYADTFEKTIDSWSTAMTAVFLKLKAKGFTNANGLLLFTEPNYPKDVEAHPELNDQYIYTAKLIDQKLKAANIRQTIRMMGPNFASFSDTVLLEKCMTEAYDCFDIFSQHKYVVLQEMTTNTTPDVAFTTFSNFVDKAKELGKGKPFWIDEYNVSVEDSLYISSLGFDDIYRGVQQAVTYNTCMNMGGVNGMMIWTIADQQWPENRGNSQTDGFYDGVLMHGLLPDMNKTMVPKSQYYAYSLLTKYTGTKGNTVYSVEYDSLDVTVSAFQLADGNWTFVVTNTNVENTLFKLDFEKPLNGLKLYRHQYVANEVKPTNAANIIPANKTIMNVKTGFTDVLKPYSVAVYTTVKG